MRNLSSKALAPITFSVFLLTGTAGLALPAFGDWSAPASLESLPGSSSALNTPAVDGCATQAPDGLSIAFNSNRAGSQDIYIARRRSTSEGYGAPQRLPAPINLTTSNEFCPTLRRGGRLYFSSTRTGDTGELYVTREGPKGWSTPEPVPNVNTALEEESTAFYEDEAGRSVMLFSRRNDDGSGGQIYQSVEGGTPTLVEGSVNAAGSNNRPSITHDGRTIFFDSTRAGTLGGPDLYYATRERAAGPFGPAIHLSSLSSPQFDARANISWNGTTLTFSSARAGSESPAPDMWFASRERDNRMEFREAPGR
ncbi:hypothetical protein OMW55_01425 [Sphingomonas sp. BN140010]|uniref:Uncharacterized protein n=1 Tax=Sphingomonas arvum TaxID=2992113 RepID=A0ABT3JBS1_9SPHN|nr:hypothetical protein [Sphingomonas sp. BN140010]MCW3796471.1 hypothetical protein [Sphingomonas sp. BN140010]